MLPALNKTEDKDADLPMKRIRSTKGVGYAWVGFCYHSSGLFEHGCCVWMGNSLWKPRAGHIEGVL
jgi:hypothetical protein